MPLELVDEPPLEVEDEVPVAPPEVEEEVEDPPPLELLPPELPSISQARLPPELLTYWLE